MSCLTYSDCLTILSFSLIGLIVLLALLACHKPKYLKIILLCAALHNTAKAQQVVVNYPGYVSYYNLTTLIPDSVIWTIRKTHLQCAKVPRANRFHATEGGADLKRDYIHSGYDQGHNSPYDDNYYSTDAEYQCFDFANMFPQRHKLNAQTWERLEDYCRKLALTYDSCRIKTSWYVTDKKIGRDSVTVPLWCKKELWYGHHHETYCMPNRDTVINHPFGFYKVDVFSK